MYWPVIFQETIKLKERLEEQPYCLNCGEDKNKDFSKTLERKSIKEINQWLTDNGLKTWKFQNFLKKKNYFDTWNQLQKGTFINDELNSLELGLLKAQLEFIATTLLTEFTKEEGIKVDIDNNKQRGERQNLQQEITDLANKPNKTPQEEAILANKKIKLGNLDNLYENSNTNSSKPNNLTPYIIGTIGIFAFITIFFLVKRKRKKK